MTNPRRLYWVVFLLALLTCTAAGLYRLPLAAHPISGMTAQAISQPGLALQLSNLNARSLPITRETIVHYSLLSQLPHTVTEVTFLVAVLDGSGNPRAGQLIHEHFEMNPGQRVDRQLRLGNLLYVDDRKQAAKVVIAIRGYTDDLGHYMESGSVEELAAAMRGRGRITFFPQEGGEPPCGNCQTYCSSNGPCANTAKALCGGRGVCSLSCDCNLQGCSCQFTCCGGPGDILP